MKRIVAVSLVVVFLELSAAPQTQTQALATKVVATIVARGFMSKLVLFTGQSRINFRDDLLARIEQGDGELKIGEYVRLIYAKSAAEEDGLPEPMFKEKKHWELTVRRDEDCDRVMKDLLFYAIANDKGECTVQQYMQWLVWSANESVPLEARVKCYSFNEGDFQETR